MNKAMEKLRRKLRKALSEHRADAEKLYGTGSVAAARWEDGYVAALHWILDQMEKVRAS